MAKPNSCPQPKLPTQAPPYPMGMGLSLFSTCQLMPSNPNPHPPYPIGHSLIFCRLIIT
ncbi:hypothetical protein HanIR_Chr14g0724631 [Helianthus annuus]|nr:hypothetical protein HanIR_Chr14g0724631 [Helianthus annuus]